MLKSEKLRNGLNHSAIRSELGRYFGSIFGAADWVIKIKGGVFTIFHPWGFHQMAAETHEGGLGRLTCEEPQIALKSWIATLVEPMSAVASTEFIAAVGLWHTVRWWKGARKPSRINSSTRPSPTMCLGRAGGRCVSEFWRSGCKSEMVLGQYI